MTLTPRFLLVLSLFQISLGLGWILGYVFLPPTIFWIISSILSAFGSP